jgi:hypothetical protein
MAAQLHQIPSLPPAIRGRRSDCGTVRRQHAEHEPEPAGCRAEITLSHRIEPDPIVRLAIDAAVRLKAHLFSIVSTEFVAEELAV